MISTFCWVENSLLHLILENWCRLYLFCSALIFLIAIFLSITPILFVHSSPKTMLSGLCQHQLILKCWCTISIPSALASFGPEKSTLLPLIRISPLVCSYSPSKIDIKVLFPAPFLLIMHELFLFTLKALSFAMIPGSFLVMFLNSATIWNILVFSLILLKNLDVLVQNLILRLL